MNLGNLQKCPQIIIFQYTALRIINKNKGVVSIPSPGCRVTYYRRYSETHFDMA